MVDSVIGFASQLVVPRDMVPIGGIISWSGSIATIPSNYALCDGNNGTPDLRNRFIIGAGDTYNVAAVGGSNDHTHALGITPVEVTAGSGLFVWDDSAILSDSSSLSPYFALALIMRIV